MVSGERTKIFAATEESLAHPSKCIKKRNKIGSKTNTSRNHFLYSLVTFEKKLILIKRPRMEMYADQSNLLFFFRQYWNANKAPDILLSIQLAWITTERSEESSCIPFSVILLKMCSMAIKSFFARRLTIRSLSIT